MASIICQALGVGHTPAADAADAGRARRARCRAREAIIRAVVDAAGVTEGGEADAASTWEDAQGRRVY